MNNTAFSFISHKFSTVELNFENVSSSNTIDVGFALSGIYKSSTGIYTLTFEFKATLETQDQPQMIARMICNAQFKFKENVPFIEIPDFFYPNSIAIVFPYIRAFVGSVSLLANLNKPIVLPTMNLTSLKDELKDNTKEIE